MDPATDAPSLAELGESSLLDQLHDLHRRLAAVRQDSQRYSSLARNVGPIPMANDTNKIIVCSLQRCVRMLKTGQGDGWQYIPSSTGLKSAIDYLGQGNAVRWVSWPGAAVDESSRDGVRRRLETDFQCHPVFLSPEMVDLYHNQFCNVVLWPLFHSLPQRSDSRLLENFGDKYDAYCSANQKFLEAVSEIYKDGDLVLVCDYQLMALPGLLRRRFPDITCGFYFHCPFPSSEFFQMLPVREALLHGVLGADLVVFNHFDYVRHFLNVCTRMLGLESSPSRVEYNGRLISLGICPMGIDPAKYTLTPKVEAQVEMLQRQQDGMKIIVGVHKLDFCKGIPEMLEAMEYLLLHYPEYRGKVCLYAVVRDAGRTASLQYRMLSRQINELVGRVNGRFGTAEYCPVRYLKQSIDHDQLVALYNCADVAIVSSIKEGINLQAMEFIATQKKSCHGVLVYSEFAGCVEACRYRFSRVCCTNGKVLCRMVQMCVVIPRRAAGEPDAHRASRGERGHGAAHEHDDEAHPPPPTVPLRQHVHVDAVGPTDHVGAERGGRYRARVQPTGQARHGAVARVLRAQPAAPVPAGLRRHARELPEYGGARGAVASSALVPGRPDGGSPQHGLHHQRQEQESPPGTT
jgi:trehalose 6-phosphate synthase